MLNLLKEKNVYGVSIGTKISNDLIEGTKSNSNYLGAVMTDNYQVGYNIMNTMYIEGCRNVAYLTLTPGTVELFDNRVAGVVAFAKEHPDMKIVTTYTGTDFAGGAEQILSSYSTKIDSLISLKNTSAIAASISNYGLTGKVKYAGIDIQEGTDQLLENGTMSYVAGGAQPNIEFAVAMLYNALSGHNLWKDNSVAIVRPLYEITSTEAYTKYMSLVEGAVPVYTGDEMKDILAVYNSSATWENVLALAGSASLDDVQTRHANIK
jgi:hypothetical protein